MFYWFQIYITISDMHTKKTTTTPLLHLQSKQKNKCYKERINIFEKISNVENMVDKVLAAIV